MTEIMKKYNEQCNVVSDINEHLPTLKRYSSLCESVTEFGVRFGTSLTALMVGCPKKLVAYDIVKNIYEEFFISSAKELNIDFTFKVQDVLDTTIEECDLLFIDTLHTYNQLSMELKLHSNKVKKYIILHDTVSFGHTNESLYDHASKIVKSVKDEKQGLLTAINEFLEEKTFRVLEDFKNNNGLMVLEKI